MKTSVALKYSGPAVQAGTMDVYAVSANMVAFSDFALVAARATYGDNVSARADVVGFARSSFLTELLIEFVGPTASIFANLTSDSIWGLVKEAIDLWKHLKGEPPKAVQHVEQSVRVTNNNGQVLQVHIGALTVVTSEKGGEAVQRFIRDALNRDGMDAVEIQSEQRTVAKVSQAESGYFVPISTEKTVTDTTIKMALVIEGPEFRPDLKWRFSDGQQSFLAEIRDEAFLRRVDAGELFGKGDVLYADVAIVQRQAGMRITAERVVIKVHEHKSAAKQLPLT